VKQSSYVSIRSFLVDHAHIDTVASHHSRTQLTFG